MVATKKRARFDTASLDSIEKAQKRRLPILPDVEDFMALEVPHPYGILPGGNQFPLSSSFSVNGVVLASTFLLSRHEEVCHQILSFCDGPDLARLAQCCRFLYAACHQLELWRDLVLRYLASAQVNKDNHGSDARNIKDYVLQTMQPTWKDTYVQLMKRGSSTTTAPHVPIAVPGVYSDYYYRLHSCRTFCIPKQWLEPQDVQKKKNLPFSVPCIPFSEMTARRFYNDFENANCPVVVGQAASQWQASLKWNTEDNDSYLMQQMDGHDFRATSGAAPLSAQFTFPAYRQYCHWDPAVLEEAPLYLFDRTALQPNSRLWKDFHPDLQLACPYWDSTACPQHDLFALLGEGRRPDHTWLIMGPKRSGSVFHMDPNATHAWNAAIRGRKRWIFYPPGFPPPGVHPSADADSVALPLTVGEWIFQFWPEHVDRLLHAPQEERPLECTAFPGDVVFVPHGWWHMVINLDEGLNIAITHNYVSQSNLPNVLKFLNEKQDQISGCRDRVESIKPHELYDTFIKSLQQHHNSWLEEALAVPQWTCRAWNAPTSPTTSARGKVSQVAKRRNCSEQSTAPTLASEQPSSSTSNTSIMARAKLVTEKDEPNSFSFSFSF
ncbi:hypothetical protein ACA910_017378 [Epithemia clementina (nom. ined.)]